MNPSVGRAGPMQKNILRPSIYAGDQREPRHQWCGGGRAEPWTSGTIASESPAGLDPDSEAAHTPIGRRNHVNDWLQRIADARRRCRREDRLRRPGLREDHSSGIAPYAQTMVGDASGSGRAPAASTGYQKPYAEAADRLCALVRKARSIASQRWPTAQKRGGSGP